MRHMVAGFRKRTQCATVPGMLSTTAEPRLTLSPRLAYAHVAAVIGLALFASATPSPLYGTYRELWGFSPVVLTLVYAVYAVGVLASLLLAGRGSRRVGPPPGAGGPPPAPLGGAGPLLVPRPPPRGFRPPAPPG